MSKSFDIDHLISEKSSKQPLQPFERYCQSPFIAPMPSLTPSLYSTDFVGSVFFSMELHHRLTPGPLTTDQQMSYEEEDSPNKNLTDISQNCSNHSTSSSEPETTNPNEESSSKRCRVSFSAMQIAELEREFSRNIYIPRLHRIYLMQKLNLSEKQIKIWFQNRRVKEKKSGDKHKDCCQKFEQLYAAGKIDKGHEHHHHND